MSQSRAILISFVKGYITNQNESDLLNRWLVYNVDTQQIKIYKKEELTDGEVFIYNMFNGALTLFVDQTVIDEIKSDSDRLYNF